MGLHVPTRRNALEKELVVHTLRAFEFGMDLSPIPDFALWYHCILSFHLRTD